MFSASPPAPAEQGLQLAVKVISKQEDLQQLGTWNATVTVNSQGIHPSKGAGVPSFGLTVTFSANFLDKWRPLCVYLS